MKNSNARRRVLERAEHGFQLDKRLPDDRQRRRIVTENLGKALRRDLGCASDMDHHRYLCRFASLKRRNRGPRIPRTDEHRTTLPDQALRGDPSIFWPALRIGVNNLDINPVLLLGEFCAKIDSTNTGLPRKCQHAAAWHDGAHLRLGWCRRHYRPRSQPCSKPSARAKYCAACQSIFLHFHVLLLFDRLK